MPAHPPPTLPPPTFCFQGVDDEVANLLVAQLLYLANEDARKDITMYINSPGEKKTGRFPDQDVNLKGGSPHQY